ncbi:hypothetical protein D3C81_2148680 [compost metagenome]
MRLANDFDFPQPFTEQCQSLLPLLYRGIVKKIPHWYRRFFPALLLPYIHRRILNRTIQ